MLYTENRLVEIDNQALCSLCVLRLAVTAISEVLPVPPAPQRRRRSLKFPGGLVATGLRHISRSPAILGTVASIWSIMNRWPLFVRLELCAIGKAPAGTGAFSTAIFATQRMSQGFSNPEHTTAG